MKRELQRIAPVEFAPAGTALNARRDRMKAITTNGNLERVITCRHPSISLHQDEFRFKPTDTSNWTEEQKQEHCDAAECTLYICDDLNTHVSTSGYGQAITPSLDRLVSRDDF